MIKVWLSHVARDTAILRMCMCSASCCPGYCRYTLYVLFFSIRCKCLIRSCSCANSPFRLKQAPAFADNLHLITKKSKRQYKVYRQYPGQHEAGYIYTTVVQTTRDRLHIYPRNSAVDENRVDWKCNHIAYRDIINTDRREEICPEIGVAFHPKSMIISDGDNGCFCIV